MKWWDQMPWSYDINIATLALLWLLLYWNIFFLFFYFQHICVFKYSIFFFYSCLTDLYLLFRVFKLFRFNSYYSLISFAIINLFSIWLLSLLFHLLPSFVLNIFSVPFNLSTNFCYYSFWCFITGYSRDYNIYHNLLIYHNIFQINTKFW